MFLLAVYAAVTILHFANGLGFEASLVGIYHDVRMATTCPGNLSAIWRFVDRNTGRSVLRGLVWGGRGRQSTRPRLLCLLQRFPAGRISVRPKCRRGTPTNFATPDGYI